MNENKDSIQNPQEAELARLIVTTLNLEVSPMQIDPRAPLYGEELGWIRSICSKSLWWCRRNLA